MTAAMKPVTLLRVCPLVGLVLSFGFRWVQRLCGLAVAWVVWPLTGRPLQQLGAACQSVWSGDMGKYSGLLVYVYVLLLLLWWLTPHSASAKVGLLSLTAMPCFTASLYYALQGLAQAARRALYLTLTGVLHPLTGGGLRGGGRKLLARRAGTTSASGDKLLQRSPPDCRCQGGKKHTRSKFYLSGESDAAESYSDASTARCAAWRCGWRRLVGAACTVARGCLVVVTWVTRGLLALPSRTPRLEARGREESNIYHNVEKQYCETLRRNNTKAALLTKLPWKSFSRLWGFLHNLYLPYYLRVLGLNIYSRMFHLDLHEAEEPRLINYRNLSALFRRRLRPGLRPIDAQHSLTSPADGKVLYLSRVQDGVLEQVKGVTYSIRGFLGPPAGIVPDPHLAYEESLNDLSDADYVERLVTKAGELFSVNPGIARWLQGLFSFNERAVYAGTWTHGFFSFTAVGATNVGSIAVDFDDELATNTSTPYVRGSYQECRFDESPDAPLTATKGEHIGEFHLGSTIVLLFEAPLDFKFVVAPGDKLKYGQPLGRCAP